MIHKMAPNRAGVSASSVHSENFIGTTLEFFCARFPRITSSQWQARFANGDVLDAHGSALAPNLPCPRGRLYYFRVPESETPIPFHETILFENEHFVIADKPHFLPVVPAGKYLHETLLQRLKQKLHCPNLVPAHRIDQDTAGLVLLTKHPAARAPYQALFRLHRVEKTYLANVHFQAEVSLPIVRSTRLQTSAQFMVMEEVPGAANTLTQITLLEQSRGYARLQLRPKTGQRHQLRVHLSALGMPIVGDAIYPQFLPEIANAEAQAVRYQNPMQLLAQRLAFIDPIGNNACDFVSNFGLRRLQDLP
jgi:tRNA pseudouridine32 synthase / 23S rRNA pseudouridine746 synthase